VKLLLRESPAGETDDQDKKGRRARQDTDVVVG
jgi:hypothetical protein